MLCPPTAISTVRTRSYGAAAHADDTATSGKPAGKLVRRHPQRIRTGALHSEEERNGNTTIALRRSGLRGVGNHARLPVVRGQPSTALDRFPSSWFAEEIGEWNQ